MIGWVCHCGTPIHFVVHKPLTLTDIVNGVLMGGLGVNAVLTISDDVDCVPVTCVIVFSSQ